MTNTNHPRNATVPSASSYQTTYDPVTDSLTEKIAYAIATVEESNPNEIEALAYSIDPDALAALLSTRKNELPRDGVVSVTFEHGPHHIQVTNDGTITIQTPE